MFEGNGHSKRVHIIGGIEWNKSFFGGSGGKWKLISATQIHNTGL